MLPVEHVDDIAEVVHRELEVWKVEEMRARALQKELGRFP